MPQWGDPDHNWEAINDCVEILCKEIPDLILLVKEKFGFVRCYVSSCDKEGNILPEDVFDKRYRDAYKKCVDKYPEEAFYILNDADYPELLEGLVKEEDCKHEGWWSSTDKDGNKINRCGVCMKILTEEDVSDA